ncbi:MAG: hypothetical protein IH853_01095 [Bacteroidetes bacterium]|nr:hypothetical protein [Bacteroidota bacterium]
MERFLSRATVCSLSISVSIVGNLKAQKRKLKLDDYAEWQRFETTLLSPDGHWFAYSMNPVEGDTWLAVKEMGSDEEHEVMHGTGPSFSDNNRWFTFSIGVFEKEEKKLKDEEKPVRLKLGMMGLSATVVDTFEFVEEFTFSGDGAFLAMPKYKAEGIKTKGTDLMVRNLEEDTNQKIGHVAEYSLSEEGVLPAVLIDANEKPSGVGRPAWREVAEGTNTFWTRLP